MADVSVSVQVRQMAGGRVVAGSMLLVVALDALHQTSLALRRTSAANDVAESKRYGEAVVRVGSEELGELLAESTAACALGGRHAGRRDIGEQKGTTHPRPLRRWSWLRRSESRWQQ